MVNSKAQSSQMNQSDLNGMYDAYLDVEAVGDVVGGGVHFGDDDVLLRHLLAELVVLGRQTLAVAAPRRVELCKNWSSKLIIPFHFLYQLS